MTRSLWLVAALFGCASSPHAQPTPMPPPEARQADPPAKVGEPTAPPSSAAAGSAASPAATGTIGTARPVLVDQIADDGSWLVICEARQDTDRDGKISVGYGMHGNMYGDRLDPYLVLGSGPGTPIDRFVTRSGNSAWLAVIRQGELEVFEASTRRSVVLPGADVRDDGYPYGDARAANIAADGSRMVYFRHDRDRDRIVIRDLASGHERVVAVDGVLWRVSLDDTGRWAQVAVLPAGAAWPVAQTSLAPSGCRGPVTSYSSAADSGERATEQWLDLERGVFVDAAKVPGEAMARFELGPRRRGDRAPGESRVRCSRDGACSDRDTGKPIDRPPGLVEYVHGARLVIRSHRKLIVFDASTGTSTSLGTSDDVESGNGPIVAIGDGLYDLITTRRVGSSITEAVVAHVGNRALLGRAPGRCTPRPGDMPYACVDGVPNLAAGGSRQLPTGPLRWAP